MLVLVPWSQVCWISWHLYSYSHSLMPPSRISRQTYTCKINKQPSITGWQLTLCIVCGARVWNFYLQPIVFNIVFNHISFSPPRPAILYLSRHFRYPCMGCFLSRLAFSFWVDISQPPGIVHWAFITQRTMPHNFLLLANYITLRAYILPLRSSLFAIRHLSLSMEKHRLR